MANIRNWKLVFGFFLVFFGFFWDFLVFLAFDFMVGMSSQKKPKNTKKKTKKNQKKPKKPKKNQKKPVATPKLVNWLGFFWFFLVFFGVSTPPRTEWTWILKTTTQFPIDVGTVVEVTCSHSDAVFKGSRQVTCTKETDFYTFSKEPSCSIPGNSIG